MSLSLSLSHLGREKIKNPYILFRGCYFQEGAEVKMDMKVEHAYRKSIETVVHWIQTKLISSKTQVFFRTYAPVHFRFASFLEAIVVSIIHCVLCVLFGEVNC
jgi:hypothetical protein